MSHRISITGLPSGVGCGDPAHGRYAEVFSRLTSMHRRSVCICGPSGSGKSKFALHVAASSARVAPVLVAAIRTNAFVDVNLVRSAWSQRPFHSEGTLLVVLNAQWLTAEAFDELARLHKGVMLITLDPLAGGTLATECEMFRNQNVILVDTTRSLTKSNYVDFPSMAIDIKAGVEDSSNQTFNFQRLGSWTTNLKFHSALSSSSVKSTIFCSVMSYWKRRERRNGTCSLVVSTTFDADQYATVSIGLVPSKSDRTGFNFVEGIIDNNIDGCDGELLDFANAALQELQHAMTFSGIATRLSLEEKVKPRPAVVTSLEKHSELLRFRHCLLDELKEGVYVLTSQLLNAFRGPPAMSGSTQIAEGTLGIVERVTNVVTVKFLSGVHRGELMSIVPKRQELGFSQHEDFFGAIYHIVPFIMLGDVCIGSKIHVSITLSSTSAFSSKHSAARQLLLSSALKSTTAKCEFRVSCEDQLTRSRIFYNLCTLLTIPWDLPSNEATTNLGTAVAELREELFGEDGIETVQKCLAPGEHCFRPDPLNLLTGLSVGDSVELLLSRNTLVPKQAMPIDNLIPIAELEPSGPSRKNTVKSLKRRAPEKSSTGWGWFLKTAFGWIKSV